MCRLRNIAIHDYQESVTTGQTHRQTPDKVIPMCRYASQVTQKVRVRFVAKRHMQRYSSYICDGPWMCRRAEEDI